MENTPKAVIHLEKLCKDFGPLRAVNAVSLEIYEGEILGFLGPNGAGKTTTINMICGLIPPSSGSIDFDFHTNEQESNPRTRIGVCPQENIFWPRLTCLEQLLFMGQMYALSTSAARASAEKLLMDMGLQEKSAVQASKLSGGMKRRLNIALALVHDPDILVLDEPEAGLDPQSRILVREFVKTLARRKTVILTTHNMDEADRMADRVAIIDQGVLQVVDRPENLKRSLGEGDTLEIQLDRRPGEDLTSALKTGLNKHCEITVLERSYTIRALDLVQDMNTISETIRGAGISIKQMALRENSLEDVFISLTGKQLRQ